MAVRGTGESSKARMASPSRSRSKVRPRPTTPEIRIATHSMPATTVGGGATPPTTNAKLKTSTTMTARKALVARISRLRHSMARSLPAKRKAWAQKPGRGARSATAALLVGRPECGGTPGLRPPLVPHHTPAPQDDHVLGQHRGGFEVVGHQHHHAPLVALALQLGPQPGHAGRVQRRARLVEQQARRVVDQGARQAQALQPPPRARADGRAPW